MFQAGTLIVDRKTGERKLSYVPMASASVGGGIQPETLARHLKPEFFECGLVARLLLAFPQRRPKGWTEAELPGDTEDRYEKLVYDLAALQMRSYGEEKGPHRLRLSGEGKS